MRGGTTRCQLRSHEPDDGEDGKEGERPDPHAPKRHQDARATRRSGSMSRNASSAAEKLHLCVNLVTTKSAQPNPYFSATTGVLKREVLPLSSTHAVSLRRGANGARTQH